MTRLGQLCIRRQYVTLSLSFKDGADKSVQEWAEFRKEVLPLIDTRTSFIGQEFAFWATSPPQILGGVYEMRTYDLVRGCLFSAKL